VEIHVNIFLKIRLIKEKATKPPQGQKSVNGLLLNHGISGLFPGFHTALDHLYVGVPIICQFCRLTDGTGLLRSGTVKNHLLAFGKSGQSRP
jgi:hypothetical protein